MKSGYPDGLSAQKIDDLTRIMTVCDVYGALVELHRRIAILGLCGFAEANTYGAA
jgi:hypothetical protein